jgi:hypothetical protein
MGEYKEVENERNDRGSGLFYISILKVFIKLNYLQQHISEIVFFRRLSEVSVVEDPSVFHEGLDRERAHCSSSSSDSLSSTVPIFWKAVSACSNDSCMPDQMPLKTFLRAALAFLTVLRSFLMLATLCLCLSS